MIEVMRRVERGADPANAATNDRLRVLYVFPGSAEGSAMIFARKQVEAMRELGVIPEIFAVESRTDLVCLRRESRRLRQSVASFRPDLIHAQYGTVTACLAGLMTMVPLVITFRGSDLNPTPSDPWLRSAVRRGFSQYAARRAIRMICVSQELKRRLWWGRDRALVLPSGVDTDLFVPRCQSDARAELGWGATERIVLFNAGLSPEVKRLDLAQAAVRKAEQLCGPIRLVLLDGLVPHAMVATMMNGADCLLLTSDWEGSPTIVQEAMACNLPVLSVDVGDVRERLAAVTPSGIVGRDQAAMARALAELLARPVRSNGRDFITAVDQHHIARQTLAVYHEALGRRDGC
jgi:teichuronic acid biosynthesis glycosyltransferase TuaC